MSRSGYTDDCDDEGRQNLWRGTVARTIRGKRGQAFLREMAAALDAMPVKELATEIIVEGSAVCAIGSVALARQLDVTGLDVEDWDAVSKVFGISPTMVREIAYQNDEANTWAAETPAERWARMRKWVNAKLSETQP